MGVIVIQRVGEMFEADKTSSACRAGSRALLDLGVCGQELLVLRLTKMAPRTLDSLHSFYDVERAPVY